MMSSRSSSETKRRARVGGWQLGLGVLILITVCVAGIVVGGEFGEFTGAGLQVLPFTVLAVMAYLGLDRQWGRVIAWIVMLALLLGFALFTFVAGVAALVDIDGASPELDDGVLAKLGLIAAGTGLAVIIGATGFLHRTRRALARALPIDPESFVHMVALVIVLTVTLMSFVPLSVIREPVILAILARPNGADFFGGLDSSEVLRQDAYALIWTVVCPVFMVGYAVRRTLHEALVRLGLVRPTRRQVLGGIGMAVVLVIGAQGLDSAIGLVWDTLAWPRTDCDLVSKLFEAHTSPTGAIVVGVTAGLGEELTDRGVLQPRLGLLLSNAFFVSLHAFQYNWDALLVVFFAGIVLGLIRRRTNTTTSAITHVMYDFLLIMAAVMEVPGFS